MAIVLLAHRLYNSDHDLEGLGSVERDGITLSQKLANFVTAGHFSSAFANNEASADLTIEIPEAKISKTEKLKYRLVENVQKQLTQHDSSRRGGFSKYEIRVLENKKKKAQIFTRNMEISLTHPAFENENNLSSQM